jgi:hypothetical protein
MARHRDESTVEVLYALRDEQAIVVLPYEPGLTAAAAVEHSGLLERYPEIRMQPRVFGIFGVEVAHEHALEPGDRVEICRPLKADPRDMRRAFLTDGRVMGGAKSKRRPRGS